MRSKSEVNGPGTRYVTVISGVYDVDSNAIDEHRPAPVRSMTKIPTCVASLEVHRYTSSSPSLALTFAWSASRQGFAQASYAAMLGRIVLGSIVDSKSRTIRR